MTIPQLATKKKLKQQIKPTDVFPNQKHFTLSTLHKPEILPLSYYFYTLQQAGNKKQYVFQQNPKSPESDLQLNQKFESLNVNPKQLPKSTSSVICLKKERNEIKPYCMTTQSAVCSQAQSKLFASDFLHLNILGPRAALSLAVRLVYSLEKVKLV